VLLYQHNGDDAPQKDICIFIYDWFYICWLLQPMDLWNDWNKWNEKFWQEWALYLPCACKKVLCSKIC